MQPSEPILADIVADLATLRDAYEKCGLLSTSSRATMAEKLLGRGEGAYRFPGEFLLFDAVLRNRVARLVIDGGALRHVAVFGGNNVGKSTVINILAADQIASTSPDGGHTQHAQGFTSASGRLFGNNGYAFRGFTRADLKDLPRDRHDRFAVTQRPMPALPSDVVVWDAPDCDAVGSYRYIAAVVETVAAADAVIYVTGLGGYASAHIVEWVLRLHDAGIPIIECLNRTEKRHREAVIRKQETDIFPMAAKELGVPVPKLRIIPLRFLSGEDAEESDLWGPEHIEATELREAAVAALKGTDRVAGGRAALDFVMRKVDRILEPARMEILARKTWSDSIEKELKNFVASYEQDYLTPDKESRKAIDPFTRLNLRILELLDPDIPGLKEAMGLIRWLTRLPAKMVIAAGRTVINMVFRDNTKPANEPLPPEFAAYANANEALLKALARQLSAERNAEQHHPFWDALDIEWQNQLPELEKDFATKVAEHMKRTDEEINKAADDIFAKLKEQPRLLNMLRGARVTATMGGLVISFLIPGKGSFMFDLLEELVLAPAMVTATETATELTVANYVGRRRAEILDKLRHEARDLARSVYYRRLVDIADKAMGAGSLGVEQDLINRLPSRLRQLQARLSG
jgi:50S ribosome-binding GTPase